MSRFRGGIVKGMKRFSRIKLSERSAFVGEYFNRKEANGLIFNINWQFGENGRIVLVETYCPPLEKEHKIAEVFGKKGPAQRMRWETEYFRAGGFAEWMLGLSDEYDSKDTAERYDFIFKEGHELARDLFYSAENNLFPESNEKMDRDWMPMSFIPRFPKLMEVLRNASELMPTAVYLDGCGEDGVQVRYLE
jgi:hypothetical protein